MDAMPGHRHEHGNEPNVQPKTSAEEGMLRIGAAIDSAIRDYKKLPMLALMRKMYMRGVITALKTVFEMLHELHHKYDNSNGELN